MSVQMMVMNKPKYAQQPTRVDLLLNNSNVLQPDMTILPLNSRFNFLENASIEMILIVVVSLDLQENEKWERLGMIELLLYVVMGDGLHCNWF